MMYQPYWCNVKSIDKKTLEKLGITGVNSIEKAQKNEMSFVNERAIFSKIYVSNAGLIICPNGWRGNDLCHLYECENPRKTFAELAFRFFPPGLPSISIGKNCQIHQTTVIGREGFGYEDGIHFPHYAGVSIGDNVDIGAHTCIDRGTFTDTTIGEGTKIDNLVHIAHGVQIGKNCLIVAGSVLGGSVEIGDNAYLMIGSLIKPHVKIGNNAKIGMGAVVIHDVKDNECVVGNPARVLQK